MFHVDSATAYIRKGGVYIGKAQEKIPVLKCRKTCSLFPLMLIIFYVIYE